MDLPIEFPPRDGQETVQGLFFPLLAPLALVRVVASVVLGQVALHTEAYSARFTHEGSDIFVDDAAVHV